MVKIAYKHLYTLCVDEVELSKDYRQEMTKGQAGERNAQLANQGLTNTRWRLCWWAR